MRKKVQKLYGAAVFQTRILFGINLFWPYVADVLQLFLVSVLKSMLERGLKKKQTSVNLIKVKLYWKQF